jgi:hypothetical protein
MTCLCQSCYTNRILSETACSMVSIEGISSFERCALKLTLRRLAVVPNEISQLLFVYFGLRRQSACRPRMARNEAFAASACAAPAAGRTVIESTKT